MSDATTDATSETADDLFHDVEALKLVQSIDVRHYNGNAAATFAAAQVHALLYIGDSIERASANLSDALGMAFAPRLYDNATDLVRETGGSVVEALLDLAEAASNDAGNDAG